jgi:hypothetical protein
MEMDRQQAPRTISIVNWVRGNGVGVHSSDAPPRAKPDGVTRSRDASELGTTAGRASRSVASVRPIGDGWADGLRSS